MFRRLTAIEIAEGALIADIAVVFQLLVHYLPIGGMYFTLLVPVVFTILLLRRTARDAPQFEVAWLWDGPRRLWQRWRRRSVVQPVPPA